VVEEKKRRQKDRKQRRREKEILERSDGEDWIETERKRRRNCGRYVVR